MLSQQNVLVEVRIDVPDHRVRHAWARIPMYMLRSAWPADVLLETVRQVTERLMGDTLQDIQEVRRDEKHD